jgi:hypothetical protein
MGHSKTDYINQLITISKLFKPKLGLKEQFGACQLG